MTKNEEEISFTNYFVPLTTTKIVHFLIIIGSIVFFNGLFNGFVGDDLGQIIDNIYVHSITNIQLFFTGSTFYNGSAQIAGLYYKPLLLTSYALLYTFFGPHAFMFHFFQIVLYIVNACLAYFIFSIFFKKSISFLLALIFLVHPLNSETALYIADLQDVLFFLFGSIGFLLYKKSSSLKGSILSGIFLFLSLLSKETGILFLGIILAYSFLSDKKNLKHSFLFTGSIAILYVLIRFLTFGVFTTPKSSLIAQLTFTERLINIPEIVFFYLKTFFYPLSLASSYQWTYTQIDIPHFFLPLFFDVVILAAIILLGYFLYKKKQFSAFLFFISWLTLGLALHLQFIPLDATVADRWFYFPMIGALGITGILIEKYLHNFKNIFLIFILLISLLAFRTFLRSFDWRDEITIASHDLQVSQTWGLENELSFAYFSKGDYTNAKVHAEKSIALYPYRTNYLNLGAAYFGMKEYKQAKNAFMKSLTYGDDYQTYQNLSLLSLSYGDPKENIAFLKNVALKKFPQEGLMWFHVAILEYNYGDKQQAKDDISKAYQLLPTQQISGTYNAMMHDMPVTIK